MPYELMSAKCSQTNDQDVSAGKSARLMKQKVDVYVWFKSDLFSICAWDRSKSKTVLYCLFIIV